MGEVAHGLLHGAEVGKRAGELLDDALERHDLVAIHDADEQRLVRMREAADGRDLRNTVLHMLEQLGGKLLRLIRDDLEFHGLLEALDHRIADVAGQEAVDQAKATLDAAKAALVKAEQPAEIDTSSLAKAISDAEALKEADYTADSWKALQSALTNAKNVLEAKESQTKVDDAANTLNNAIKGLVKKSAQTTQTTNKTNNTTNKTGTTGTTTKASGTKTGDVTSVLGWLGLAVSSLGAGVGGVTWKRRKRK